MPPEKVGDTAHLFLWLVLDCCWHTSFSKSLFSFWTSSQAQDADSHISFKPGITLKTLRKLYLGRNITAVGRGKDPHHDVGSHAPCSYLWNLCSTRNPTQVAAGHVLICICPVKSYTCHVSGRQLETGTLTS